MPNWAATHGSAAGLTVLPELRNTITLHNTPSTHYYAASPFFLFFFFVAFSFLVEGLKTETMWRMPPRYSHVQIKTTAKLKKMYIHMMPAVSLANHRWTGESTHTEVSPDVPWKYVETGCKCIPGSELTKPTVPVRLRLDVSA